MNDYQQGSGQYGNQPTAPRGKPGYLKLGNGDKFYVDYKSVEDLRRLMTPNGKIYSRKRLGVSAREQRMVAQAIKRARYMALLPYTSATV
jgi:small subunit ribosomal protein S18